MNTAFPAKLPPLTTLFVVMLRAGELADGTPVINVLSRLILLIYRHMSYDLLVRCAKDAMTPVL